MSNLSLVEAKLPPGFRFHPKDEELICDYLMKKVESPCDQNPLMIEVDLNKCEPWDIPETAYLGGKEWYFYSQRDRKYATGLRTNRATTTGYWKATGKDRAVYQRGSLVGMRKTLVFYQGRAPKGRKTEWVMHEFRLEGPSLGPPKPNSSLKEDWVLCRMFYKADKEAHQKQEEIENTNSSSSIINPPLTMDYEHNNIMTYDDQYHHIQYEQVPCFSIFNPTTSTTFSHITTQMPPTPTSTSLLNPSISCDKKFINEFLNHFAKMESKGSTSLGGGEGSSESFLSDVEFFPNNIWNNY